MPEQTAATIYAYNNDDTLLSITDGRSAVTTYARNGRHLVTGMSYSVPHDSTIPVPASVSYTYDAAGNRTEMIDGMGTVSYTYNTLSQMISETRGLTGASPGSYSMSYQYNLAGQLTSITDPNNNSINYARDLTGRMSAITGTPINGITTYVSSMSYRAWGAVKQVNYGNGKTLNATYNDRLKAQTFQIAGLMSKTYEYYADGTLRFSSEALDHRFDRLYRWDHMGRIKEALSGAEARGGGATTDRPYKQLFAYDAIGHLTDRTKYWWFLGPNTSSDSYTNNRHDPVGQLWQYDSAGNTLSMPGTAYTYDASGRISSMNSDIPSTATISRDGDGNKVKSVEVVWDSNSQSDITTTSYFIHSTVLGRMLTEIASSDDPDFTVPGFYTRTLVYGDNGGVIAYQMGYGGGSGEVWFEYRDPSNATYRAFTNIGAPSLQQELDPTGANQGVTDPATQSIPDQGLLAPYPNTFNPSEPFAAYSTDGMRVSLDEFVQQVRFQFHGELGLNEAIAQGSLNLPRTNWSPPLNSEDDSLLTSSSMWLFQTQTGGKVAHQAIDIDDLRSGIQDILQDSKGRCEAFISSLITGTATERNAPEFTKILDLFDAVQKQGGFIRGDTIKGYYGVPGATNRGSISGRNAQVELPFPWPGNNPTNNKDIAASQRRIELFEVILELIHLSGKKGYEDIQLANTVAAMKGIAPPVYTGMTSKQATLAASISWTDSLRIACKSRKK